MGFSGGGSNILKSHTHDGTIAQDGGSLNMDNVTQAALTSGDIVYSDGVHLQRLPIGAVNTTLSSTGAVPQWAAAGGSAYELLSSTRLGADGSTISCSFASQDGDNIGSILAYFSCMSDEPNPYSHLRINFNGLTASNYYCEWIAQEGGAGTFSRQAGDPYIEIPTSCRQFGGWIYLQCGTPQQTAAGHDTIFTYQGQISTEQLAPVLFGTYSFGGSYDNMGTQNTSFDNVTLTLDAGNFRTGGIMSVFKNSV